MLSMPIKKQRRETVKRRYKTNEGDLVLGTSVADPDDF
jgi:hypothetical protein